MLSDRKYMNRPFRDSFSKSHTDIFIIFLVIVFIINSVLEFTPIGSKFLQIFAFSNISFQSFFVWTPFTYSFFHDGPFHLIFNLLGIHFISRQVETDIGPNNFRWLVGICVISGAFFWLFTNPGNGILVGASALVVGSLTYFCLSRPNQPITFLLFFLLPITLKPKVILFFVILLEVYGFIFAELRQSGDIAHSAHLGGMLGSFLTFLFLSQRKDFPVISFSFRASPNNSKVSSSSPKVTPNGYKVNISNQSLQHEIDKILDKINEQGFGSLTQNEKNLLDKAKSLLRK